MSSRIFIQVPSPVDAVISFLKIVVIVLGLLIPCVSNAQTVQYAEGHMPKLCYGILKYPEISRWGFPLEQNCPKNSAVYGNSIQAVDRFRPASKIPLTVYCCPLPAKDILTDESITVSEECPVDFVVTGGKVTCDDPTLNSTNCTYSFRCTKINTARYKLTAAFSGGFWGYNSKYWRQPLLLMRADIPAGLRLGMGRLDQFSWTNRGCIGLPYGSLLTARLGRTCDAHKYRQLQFVDQKPVAGTSSTVPMFPDCKHVLDIYSENPRCVDKLGH